MNVATPIDQAANDAQRMPHNVDAEAALLGAMMIENKLIDRVADIVQPAHFFEPMHSDIFSAIVREASMGRVVTPITLKPYFDSHEGMNEVGGPSYMTRLTASDAAVIGAIDFANQVRDLAHLRMMIGGLQEVIAKASDCESSPAELAALAEVTLSHVSDVNSDGGNELSLSQCVRQAREGIESQQPGVTCGIAPIDAAIGPIYRKDLVILAARPSMGKTCAAISYAMGAARKGHGVLFVSLETSGEQIGQRAACDWAFDSNSCQLPYEAVTEGKLNEVQMRQLCRAELAIDELPFQVIDEANLSVHKLARMVRRWKRRFAARGQSLDLVVVDYLQQMRAHGLTNRFEVVTEISQTLKQIAKENDLGVMALAQLSRKVEEREDKRPHMADLRESGQLEQDGDVVCFLYRAEYYLERSEPPAHKEAEHVGWEVALEDVRGEIEFICAKRKKGRAGTAKGRFYGAFQAVRGAYE